MCQSGNIATECRHSSTDWWRRVIFTKRRKWLEASLTRVLHQRARIFRMESSAQVPEVRTKDADQSTVSERIQYRKFLIVDRLVSFRLHIIMFNWVLPIITFPAVHQCSDCLLEWYIEINVLMHSLVQPFSHYSVKIQLFINSLLSDLTFSFIFQREGR